MGILCGVGIILGNIVDNNALEVTDLASSLGARVLRPEDALQATYLIASNVLRSANGSDPYLAATQRNPRLSVVSPSWLTQCQAAQRQVPPAPFLLLPLTGVSASITNFGAKERNPVMQQLSSGGARPSPELLRQMTHLVGKTPGGNKHVHAKEWGLFVVHHDWVVDSIKAGHRLDERPYSLDTYVPRDAAPPGQPGGGLARQPSGPPASERCDAEAGCGAQAGAAAGPAPARQGSANVKGVVAPVPGAQAPAAAGAGGLPRNGSSGALQPANGPGPGGPAGAYRDLQQQQQPGNQYFCIPAVPPDDCFFLHWVRLWLVGCTPSEMPHVLAAVRESGATREPVPSGEVTHIVFGSVLSTADLAAVRQHMGEHREQVKLARLGWLYECVNRRAYVEPEGPYSVALSQLLHGPGGFGAGPLAPAQAGRVAGPRSREPSPAPFAAQPVGAPLDGVGGGAAAAAGGRGVAPLDDYVPLEPEGNTRTMDSVPRAGPGVFSGLWFTLAAVAGTPDEGIATKLVRQGGGMIMSACTERDVRESHRRFAVCPFSLPQPAIDRLCTRGRDRMPTEFERVPVEQRVTVAFLRACIEGGELLSRQDLRTPLYRPLPHPLPLPGTSGVVMAISGYDAPRRELLQELVTHLGPECAENFSKRCKFLIVLKAEGRKYELAVKWGIPCVNDRWLVHSAHAGRLLDPRHPGFVPEGTTLEQLEEKRAAAARGNPRGGAAGGPASQLGPTQRPHAPGPSQMPATMPVGAAHGATQQMQEGRLASGAPGLPPRPTQGADRRAPPTQAPGGTLAAPAPTQQHGGAFKAPAPPATATAHLAPDAAVLRKEEAPRVLAPPPSASARPQSGMQPLIKAILDAENSETEAEDPPARRAGPPTRQRGGATVGVDVEGAGAQAGPSATAPPQASGNPPYSSASAQLPGGSAANPPATLGEPGATLATGMGTAGPDTAGTNTSAAGACADPRAGPPAQPPLTAAPAQGPGQPTAAPGQEHGAAAASLLQFLNSNQFVPDMACSQLDMPPPLPVSALPSGAGQLGPEGSLTATDASRQLGTMKPPEGDAGGAGRRSRKRNASAAVGEAQGVPGKVGGLPGRRGRSAEEEEGFGVAMSQQVGYEAEAAALAPRVTRSTSRGRGGHGGDVKLNLIKAVQGNTR